MSEKFSELSKFISDPTNSISQNEPEVEHLLTTLKKLAESPVNDLYEVLKKLQSSPIKFEVQPLVEELKSQSEDNSDVRDLLEVIERCHLKSLISCHDMIAIHDYGLPKFNADDESVCSEEDQVSMKVVRMVKTDEPLGATISYDRSEENIIVARILHGGMADKEGIIHADDVINEINGKSTQGMTPSDVTKILSQHRGALVLKLIPRSNKMNISKVDEEEEQDKTHIKTNFAFDPLKDNLIPCKKVGLSFERGDILCVQSKDDIAWWQATKVQGDILNTKEEVKTKSVRAGIIPSFKLQQRRDRMKEQMERRRAGSEGKYQSGNGSMKSARGSSMSLMNHRNTWNSIKASFRRKNTSSQRGKTLSRNGSTVSTQPLLPRPTASRAPPYEVVGKMVHPPSTSGVYRPIVLVGPTGVGRNDLKERLIDCDPDVYGVPVPHTSRDKLSDEKNGLDYHFVSRNFMENGIKNKFFLEFGEYKSNFYGTSIEAVKEVARNGKICILTPGPQAIEILRTKELQPYVVFIKPPTMEQYDNDELGSFPRLKPRLTLDRETSNGLTKLELHDLVVRAREMSGKYSHLFDCSVTCDDPAVALRELKRVVDFVQNNSMYVPVAWIES